MSLIDQSDAAVGATETLLLGTEREVGPDDLRTVDAREWLATLRGLRHEWAEARDLMVAVLAQREALQPGEHVDILRCRRMLAYYFLRLGDHHSARRLQELIVDVVIARDGRYTEEALASRYNLARTMLLDGDTSAGREILDDVVERGTETFGPDDAIMSAARALRDSLDA